MKRTGSPLASGDMRPRKLGKTSNSIRNKEGNSQSFLVLSEPERDEQSSEQEKDEISDEKEPLAKIVPANNDRTIFVISYYCKLLLCYRYSVYLSWMRSSFSKTQVLDSTHVQPYRRGSFICCFVVGDVTLMTMLTLMIKLFVCLFFFLLITETVYMYRTKLRKELFSK